MTNLNGKVALVTGATLGVGNGVALELSQVGVTVYATGRTITEETFAADGQVIPVPCDHTRDSEVEAVFQRKFVAAALAQDYGFTDVDGKQPRPLKLEEV